MIQVIKQNIDDIYNVEEKILFYNLFTLLEILFFIFLLYK